MYSQGSNPKITKKIQPTLNINPHYILYLYTNVNELNNIINASEQIYSVKLAEEA